MKNYMPHVSRHLRTFYFVCFMVWALYEVSPNAYAFQVLNTNKLLNPAKQHQGKL